MRLNIFSLFALVSLLTACSGGPGQGGGGQFTGGTELVQQFLSTNAPLAPYQTGNGYEVNGVRYQPQENFNYDEIGDASYYSSTLSGALTASSEKYNSRLMTAAHKTLPFQSIVKVTHLKTGRSVVVRINDRGPFISGRLIDLSEAAANGLGISDDGVARVRIQVLSDETKLFRSALSNNRKIPSVASPETPTPSNADTSNSGSSQSTTQALQPNSQNVSGGFYILVGSYTSSEDANAIRDRMSQLGKANVENSSGVYKVYIGPLSSRLDAQAMLGRVFAQGATNASVVQR